VAKSEIFLKISQNVTLIDEGQQTVTHYFSKTINIYLLFPHKWFLFCKSL